MDSDRLPGPLERPLQTFSGQAVEVLREMVLSGRLHPGERLNEVALAEALGISRGPLREAIQRLHSEGLITTVSHRGAFVRTFTPEKLGELYEVRIALEAHALRLAAISNPDGIESLHTLLDKTSHAIDEDPAYPRDLDFHQRIVELTGNQTLLEAVIDVHRKIDLARSRSAHEPDRARRALGDHEQIVKHLVDGRTETAVKVLTKHLRSALDNALRILDAETQAVEQR